MSRSIILVIFIIVSYNSLCQVSKGDVLGFVEGSFSSKQSNEKTQDQKRLSEKYSLDRVGSCHAGLKFLVNKYISVGFSIGLENSKSVSSSKAFEMPSYIDSFNIHYTYLTNASYKSYTSRSIMLMPSLGVYKTIGKSGILLFEFSYYRQYANSSEEYQSYYFRSYSDHHLSEYAVKWKDESWGFSFKPYFILKGVNRFYLSYSPLNFSYFQFAKKHSGQRWFRSTFETNFMPLSLGLFFKLN